MSARYVRNTIRGWAASTFTVPFYDTINMAERPTDPIWATVEFDTSADTKLTFCDDLESSGLADFVFSGAPGMGDDAVLAAAEASIAELLKMTDPTGALVLLYAHQPAEFSNGLADYTYRVFVAVEYRHYYRQAA